MFRKSIEEYVKCFRGLYLLKDVNMSTYSKVIINRCHIFRSPVTVSSAERSFSKLKLVKNYLHSSISEDLMDSLAVLSKENK